MSMCTCERCDRMIDSDDDPDCFVEVGNMRRLHSTIVLCEWCRDDREAQLEADAQQQAVAEGMAQ